MIINSTFFCRSSQHPSCLVDGEAVLLDIDQGAYLCLNGVASRIWELLATPKTLQTIIETLLQEFEVTPSTCEQATKDFLEKLLSKGLITKNA